MRVEPWKAVKNVELGEEMLGAGNQLSPEQLRSVFGWTPFENFIGSTLALLRRTYLWKACIAVKEWLFSKTRNSGKH